MLGLKTHTAVSGFYMDAFYLNLDPHDFTASTLMAELPPLPLISSISMGFRGYLSTPKGQVRPLPKTLIIAS